MGRRNYWTCSAFADWLRGTTKPGALTSKGWSEWNREAKKKYPIRYWIAEEGLDRLQNFIMWPIDRLYDVKYYINNRWVTKTHMMATGLEPGQWHEYETRLLHSMFNELVNFVEVELAWFHIAWSDEDKAKYDAPFWARGWFRWRTWRCPQAGIDNLNWQRSLKYDEQYCTDVSDEKFGQPTPQAVSAQEIYDLYHWWTAVRPLRPDPYEASGWRSICDARRESNPDDILGEDDTPAQREQSGIALDKIREMEENYERDDEEHMIRLIKVRRSLWT